MTRFTDAEPVHVPTAARVVFDVSGAGDTVIVTVVAMLGAALPLLKAIEHANSAAGVVVGKVGTLLITYYFSSAIG